MTRIVSALVLFLFLFLPFIWFPGQTDPYEYPKVMLLIVIVTITLGLYKCCIVTAYNKNVNYSIIIQLLGAILVIQAISIVVNGSVLKGVFGQYFRYQGIVTFISLIGLLYIVVKSKKFNSSLSTIINTITLSSIGVSVVICLQAMLYFVFQIPVYTFAGRMTAFMGNPNFAAAYIALCFPFVVYSLKTRGYSLLFNFMVWTVSLIAIVLTFSRGALAAYLIISLWYIPGKLKYYAAVVLLVVLSFAIPYLSSDRISSFDNRTTIYTYAVQAALQKPLVGWGVENFEAAFNAQLTPTDFDLANVRVDKAHNEFLEIAVTTGLIGLILWLSVYVLVGKMLYNNRDNALAYAALLAFVSFILISMTNVINITSYVILYTIIATAVLLETEGKDALTTGNNK